MSTIALEYIALFDQIYQSDATKSKEVAQPIVSNITQTGKSIANKAGQLGQAFDRLVPL